MLRNSLIGAGGGFKAMTYDVAAGSPTHATTTSLAVGYPADVQAGDLLVVVGTMNRDDTPTVSGWDNSEASPYVIFSQKIATGTESGSVSVVSPSGVKVAVMIRIRNSYGLPFTAKKATQTNGYATSTSTTLIPDPGISYTYFANIIGFAQSLLMGYMTSWPSSYADQIVSYVSGSSLFFAFIDTQALDKEGDTVSMSASGTVSWRSFYIYH